MGSRLVVALIMDKPQREPSQVSDEQADGDMDFHGGGDRKTESPRTLNEPETQRQHCPSFQPAKAVEAAIATATTSTPQIIDLRAASQ
jgi:hypothetical protein